MNLYDFLERLARDMQKMNYGLIISEIYEDNVLVRARRGEGHYERFEIRLDRIDEIVYDNPVLGLKNLNGKPYKTDLRN